MSWFSGTLAGQLAMFTNILAKISGYQAALGLTAAMVTEIETICQLFIAAYNHTESNKATSQGTTAWRDLLFYGEPTGEALPAAPVFTNIGAVVGTIGIITRFFEIRDLLVKLDGYTKAIGEDLMIVAPESGDPLPEANVAPALKLTVAGTGYRVTIKASLQGRDALQVEYKPNGGTWTVLKSL